MNFKVIDKMKRTALLKLTEKYDSPLYVYDAEKIISQYNKITKAFSKVKNVKD